MPILIALIFLLILSIEVSANTARDKIPLSTTPNSRLLTVGGSTLDVLFSDDIPEAQKNNLTMWVKQSANTVTHYYGSFPVKQAGITLIGTDDSGVSSGRAMQGTQSPQILVWVGRDVSTDTLASDWVMIHEMIHLATASLNPKHRWFEEGLSVYLEAISRAQIGALDRAGIWREFVQRMPHGQLQGDDKGLSENTRWGRTYWGGAVFFLIADIHIRERSNNMYSLSDAVKGIVSSGLTMDTSSDIQTVLRVMDDALPSPELIKLYKEYALQANPFPLKEIWQQLGINVKTDATFNDLAPLACIRKAITLPYTLRCKGSG